MAIYTEHDENDGVPGASYEQVTTPRALRSVLPMSWADIDTVRSARHAIRRILDGSDDRLLVVVGPCSLHDTSASLDYAQCLLGAAKTHASDLQIVMRAYFEKPRTTLGWKGLINDPDLDESYRIDRGLRRARGLLLQLCQSGLPVACELLDTISPLYLNDCISWGAIGARTAESQLHRQLASGADFPIGFKNGTGGDLQVAVDGMVAAAQPHSYLSVNSDGCAAICRTRGNAATHIVLRGGRTGPNYGREQVRTAMSLMREAGVHAPGVMVDCSHGNAGGDFRNQIDVCSAVAEQVGDGDGGLIGVMIESFLEPGRQSIATRPLVYGQSVTDACVSWGDTGPMLAQLADAVRRRRCQKGRSDP